MPETLPEDASELIDLSVLIPVYNEVENVSALHSEIRGVLSASGIRYEIVFVDDGSTDGTPLRLGEIQDHDPEHVRVALLRRNCGQTAALSAALDLAVGRILVPMDGDRQNDPADIPRLVDRLEEGFDVVSGWRKDRKDRFLTRRVPSWLANRLVARLSNVPLHDFGCTLKAYRRSVLQGVRLYGEMHRFIPVFAAWQGAKVTEMIVNHRPRTAGRSKYGLGRTLNVVLDLILIRFYQRYAQRPMHVFGRFGLLAFAASFVCFGLMLYYKYVYVPMKTFIETPLPTLCVMFFLAGIVGVLMGLLAEMIMRTYYESQSKTTYLLGQVRRPSESPSPADPATDGRSGESGGLSPGRGFLNRNRG